MDFIFYNKKRVRLQNKEGKLKEPLEDFKNLSVEAVFPLATKQLIRITEITRNRCTVPQFRNSL